ncbi:MAG: Carbon starvation protein A [Lentisphaerae bacterium ADurb.Bin082]|nr:MAG: Carbon starvation protein A [Lentisphaerae bacterium ADurb.Bin082]HQL87612.1 carbon starvation protein A [Lentisphaeria bacterium]
MNASWLLILGGVLFLLAYFIYGGYLKRVFGIDPQRPCPSHTHEDGVDYTPTSPLVLFGHHFASIAGAGPIVGPIIAAMFGWGPAFLWIVIGCIFVGSMHDFAALFLSVRNQGRSIAYVIERELGYVGRQIFLFFCLASLILVVTVFTIMTAQSFVSTPAVATASCLFIFMAPCFAITTRQKMLGLAEASILFVPLLFLCIWIGTVLPLDLTALLGSASAAQVTWRLVLLYYCFVASILPVWFMLQPRDYLNAYLLGAMMILGVVGVLAYRPQINMPAFVNPQDYFPGCKHHVLPGLLPLLFVTIACGACSGFHALVSSGTSSKQLDNERHIQPIGMGAMMVEGLLAILAVISIAQLDFGQYFTQINNDNVPPAMLFSRGIAVFVSKLGISTEFGTTFIALAVSAFMLTSLDTATRLARFIWQELALPASTETEGADDTAAEQAQAAQAAPWKRAMANRWIATGGVVILSGIMVFTGSGLQVWPVFGASNQLLAALTLIVVFLWLLRTRRKTLFALIPAVFMMTISIWSLVILVIDRWGKNKLLSGVGVFLLAMALLIIGLTIKTVQRLRAEA